MPKLIPTLFLLVLCTLGVNGSAEAAPAAKYSLSVARVANANPAAPEWVFIVGGTGSTRGGETVCKTVASLKKLLASLPRGSTLEWSPTCSGESEVLRMDLADLKAICDKGDVKLVIHPSG